MIHKNLLRGIRRHQTEVIARRRVKVDQREHSNVPHVLGQPGVYLDRDRWGRRRWGEIGFYREGKSVCSKSVCNCFFDAQFLGEARNRGVNQSHYGAQREFVRYYWKSVRGRVKRELLNEIEPAPDKTRHSVRWSLA